MNRFLSIKFLFFVISISLILSATVGEISAKGPTSNVYLNVKGGGAGDGIWGPLQEPSPAEAQARMMLNHARNQKRLQLATSANSAAAESMDFDVNGDGILDIAVVVDNGKIIIPARAANALDLAPGMRIRYTPTVSATFLVELAEGQSLDPGLGPNLGLGDDDFEPVALTAPFPFLGATYNGIFVGSDGHITLGAGDGSSTIRDAARHIGGPPRLSALLTDLDATCGGSIHADVRSDRVVVTWNQVVHFERGSADGCSGVPTNTIQAILYSSGMIDFIYGDLDTGLISQAGSNREAVTGIAEGGSEGPLNEIDMTTDLPLELAAGAIFEQFSQGTPETFDLVQLSQEFYRSHADKYDFLVAFTDFEIFGGGTAFNAGIKNQTLGLGRALFDFSGLLGSAGELESFVWMNNINLWAGNNADDYINPQLHTFRVTTSPRLTSFLGGNITPNSAPYELVGMLDITGPGNSTGYTHHGRALIHENPHTEARAPQGALRYDLNSAISIMFQEADHRWSAFSAFVHPTKGIVVPDSFDLLGRDLAHWSTFFNTGVVNSPFTQADGMPRFSGMEGNALIQLALDANGAIIDQNNPTRVLADPQGELADAIASCQDQDKGAYLTEGDELIDGATQLDQYLMGVRVAGDVSPFWYVDDPSSPIDGRSLDEPFPTFNVDDIAFCGVRVDLTVDNITDLGTILGIPARGPRVPAIGDENDVGLLANCLAENLGSGPCVDVKTMAWILLVRSGPPNSGAHMPAINRLNEFRQAWQEYVDGPGLGGRNADGVERAQDDPNFISKFDTSLEPDTY
jgi:hypothetical protein